MVQNETETKQMNEKELMEAMASELSDEQLQQLAEGMSSWGAGCNKGC